MKFGRIQCIQVVATPVAHDVSIDKGCRACYTFSYNARDYFNDLTLNAPILAYELPFVHEQRYDLRMLLTRYLKACNLPVM